MTLSLMLEELRRQGSEGSKCQPEGSGGQLVESKGQTEGSGGQLEGSKGLRAS